MSGQWHSTLQGYRGYQKPGSRGRQIHLPGLPLKPTANRGTQIRLEDLSLSHLNGPTPHIHP